MCIVGQFLEDFCAHGVTCPCLKVVANLPKIFVSTLAHSQGNLAFYYALCSLAIIGGLYPFKDVLEADRAQEQHLKEVTSTLYGEDIDSRGWEKNSMFGI